MLKNEELLDSIAKNDKHVTKVYYRCYIKNVHKLANALATNTNVEELELTINFNPININEADADNLTLEMATLNLNKVFLLGKVKKFTLKTHPPYIFSCSNLFEIKNFALDINEALAKTKIEHVQLFCRTLGNKAAIALGGNSKITSLSLICAKGITAEMMITILQNLHLISLNIRDNELRSPEIIKTIADHPCLKYLVISYNHFDDQAVYSLFSNPRLEYLDLEGGNQISAETKMKLNEFVKTNNKARRQLFIDQVTTMAQGLRQNTCFSQIPVDVFAIIFGFLPVWLESAERKYATTLLTFSNILAIKEKKPPRTWEKNISVAKRAYTIFNQWADPEKEKEIRGRYKEITDTPTPNLKS